MHLLGRKNLICLYGQHTIYTSDYKIVVAYVNCVLKVNANEVIPDQDDVEQYFLSFDEQNFTELIHAWATKMVVISPNLVLRGGRLFLGMSLNRNSLFINKFTRTPSPLLITKGFTENMFHSGVSYEILERLSTECHKTKTKVIILANHNRYKHHNEPIRI